MKNVLALVITIGALFSNTAISQPATPPATTSSTTTTVVAGADNARSTMKEVTKANGTTVNTVKAVDPVTGTTTFGKSVTNSSGVTTVNTTKTIETPKGDGNKGAGPAK
jgi:hypothetical protein